MTQQKSASAREPKSTSDVLKLRKPGHTPVKKSVKEFGEAKDKKNDRKKKDEIFRHPGCGGAVGRTSFARPDVDSGFTHALLEPQTNNSGDPGENHGTVLGRLVEFYESEETADQEENEIDLMFQLYDMTSHNVKSDD